MLFDWPFAVVGGAVVYAELVLGLIERHIRKEVLRRAEARERLMLSSSERPEAELENEGLSGESIPREDEHPVDRSA